MIRGEDEEDDGNNDGGLDKDRDEKGDNRVEGEKGG